MNELLIRNLINAVIKLSYPNWAEIGTFIVAIAALIGTIWIAIKQVNISKTQTEISKQQVDISKNQTKISLFKMRVAAIEELKRHRLFIITLSKYIENKINIAAIIKNYILIFMPEEQKNNDSGVIVSHSFERQSHLADISFLFPNIKYGECMEIYTTHNSVIFEVRDINDGDSQDMDKLKKLITDYINTITEFCIKYENGMIEQTKFL